MKKSTNNKHNTSEILILDSITKSGTESEGAVIVSGSHGGIYAAFLACKSKARAVILHDAGVGKDGAGIGGLAYCEKLGIAAACVDYRSARIGSGEDMFERGRISFVNALAHQFGCSPGISCREAAEKLTGAVQSDADIPVYAEARVEIENDGPRRVICVDSASLVTSDDSDQIVITGSHGGLLGGNPAAAIKAPVFAAVFNDAGIGIDNAGIGRLAALDERGIAAATVAAASARIGDGRSGYYDGVISVANSTAQNLGAAAGCTTVDFVALLSLQAQDS